MRRKTIKLLNRIFAAMLSIALLSTTGKVTILAESIFDEEMGNVSLADNEIVSDAEESNITENDDLGIDMQALEIGITLLINV